MPVSTTNSRCAICKEPITDDGYGDVVHTETGAYGCQDDKGVATV